MNKNYWKNNLLIVFFIAIILTIYFGIYISNIKITYSFDTFVTFIEKNKMLLHSQKNIKNFKIEKSIIAIYLNKNYHLKIKNIYYDENLNKIIILFYDIKINFHSNKIIAIKFIYQKIKIYQLIKKSFS